ncbi:nicotinate (nicotinamide) nucleotide adenylyltransferase [Acanthamoeba castellanii str. Neff]|uniref:Nicotinamide-nucleotide adenylyltransferase n=1 Tax=Acanthamoeba castellanii (strain ATCC 30010 / Neff) TaxID=1257118 RepID=L8HK06_ACACF|nr:nicotinate (nicotinamide) nucleotide adenylyltransferase [Acanthamoeba castellanii str. Neff]ELR24721.1 nicotinate (nicotinamide) nucleotide adenylyltransferase [Acanthamoeba castellanii str. Neff]
MQADFPFSLDKLGTPSPGKRGVVLLACGSFSPITNMHLRIFEDARTWFQIRDLGLEVVGGYLSPVTDAYKKKGLASATHRLEMCKRAVENSDWINVDGWEAAQDEFQRTVVVLQYFDRKINENRSEEDRLQVMLLCGSDLLASFNTPGVWADEDLEVILGKYGVACIQREGSDAMKSIVSSDILFRHLNNIHLVPTWIPNDVSSTRIRQMLNRGLSVKYFMPDRVIQYIQENNLYANPPA